MIPVVHNIVARLLLELGKLAIQEMKELLGIDDQVEALSSELKLIRAYLRETDEKRNDEQHVVRELLCQIREVVFRAEDIIDTLVLEAEKLQRMNPLEKIFNKATFVPTLRELLNEIKTINNKIDKIYKMKTVYAKEMNVNDGGCKNPQLDAWLRKQRMKVEEEEVVGFKDVESKLLGQLTGGPKQLQIVSVVGMGGLGKTTVAKKLYNHKVTKYHFPCRGWSFVSEDHNVKQVICDVLRTVSRVRMHTSQMKVDDLKQELKNSLKGRKYLVFLDDIWKMDMWDEVREYFPNDCNGSRIVITTRDTKVAKHATRNPPHMLRKLDEKETWILFCNKVFKSDPCPPNLVDTGKKIVKRCDGLPLAIVVLGSMLATEEQSEARWSKMVDYVSSLVNDKQECVEILRLSYQHLPRQLKPCFLYFAAFPEDYEMSARRLISIWIADGLVQPNSQLPMVLAAERYLEMLIDRSLVQIGERSSDGGVKTCQIHDLLRDLCIKEAQQENFLITSKILLSSSPPVTNKPRRVSSVHLHTPEIIKQGKVQQRTIFSAAPIYNARNLVALDPSCVRSLISFDKEGNLSEGCWKVLTNNFKLLRVLDLGDHIWNFSVPDSIANLTNLRYLRLRISKSCLPSSIFNLWNLQFLIIEGDYTFTLPVRLYNMHQLQHLILRLPCTLSRLPSKSTKKPLTDLEVLASVIPSVTLESLVKRKMFPSIKKLALTGSKEQKPWTLAPYLTHLPLLQTLKIVRHSFPNSDCLFQGVKTDILSSLTKITLISSILTQDAFEILGKFPNLQVLKLSSIEQGTTITRSLQVNQPLFPKLHTLHLKKVVDMKRLQVEDGALLMLRYLLVRQCTNLRRISRGLFQMPNLQIELLQPHRELVKQVDDLKKENKVSCRLLV